jgi:hypothetical protein
VVRGTSAWVSSPRVVPLSAGSIREWWSGGGGISFFGLPTDRVTVLVRNCRPHPWPPVSLSRVSGMRSETHGDHGKINPDEETSWQNAWCSMNSV